MAERFLFKKDVEIEIDLFSSVELLKVRGNKNIG